MCLVLNKSATDLFKLRNQDVTAYKLLRADNNGMLLSFYDGDFEYKSGVKTEAYLGLYERPMVDGCTIDAGIHSCLTMEAIKSIMLIESVWTTSMLRNTRIAVVPVNITPDEILGIGVWGPLTAGFNMGRTGAEWMPLVNQIVSTAVTISEENYRKAFQEAKRPDEWYAEY